MSTYRVFLGAPTLADIEKDANSYSWKTISTTSNATGGSTKSSSRNVSRNSTSGALVPPAHEPDSASGQLVHPTNGAPSSAIFPFDPATLEAASQKISMLYKDIVFSNEEMNEEMRIDNTEHSIEDLSESQGSLGHSKSSRDVHWQLLTPLGSEEMNSGQRDEKGAEISVFRGIDQTTVYTWAPTEEQPSRGDGLKSSQSFVGPSFLLPSQDLPLSSFVVSQSLIQTPLETQTQPESQSFNLNSFSSSIGRFPSFHFNLHTLTSLTSLNAQAATTKTKVVHKIDVLLAALELEGPETIKIKKGVDAGKEVSIFKMILGDDEGEVCKLTAWREIADDWGGNGKMVGPKRGDILFMENVTATSEPKTATTLSASTFQRSSLTICYRTMPYAHEDGGLRPDLRLGSSEPCVRKVASVVRWFEEMAGLN
ncbi:hypothetical protein CPB83DRAFT_861887, partial [Crepidotus variabilis]